MKVAAFLFDFDMLEGFGRAFGYQGFFLALYEADIPQGGEMNMINILDGEGTGFSVRHISSKNGANGKMKMAPDWESYHFSIDSSSPLGELES
jgi:hypothetical protein